MHFLIIVFVAAVERYSNWLGWLQRDGWFTFLLRRFAGLSARQPWLPLIFTVALPVLLLSILLLVLHGQTLLLWLVNLLVLIYSVGRHDWRNEVKQLIEALGRSDRESVLLHLNHIEPECTERQFEQIEDVWPVVRNSLLYRQLESFYVVVFWFFIFGAPAALLYRLLFLYEQHESCQAKQIPAARRILSLAEWLPSRLVSLLFCVTGNFATCFQVWKDYLLKVDMHSAQVLGHCADMAIVFEHAEHQLMSQTAAPEQQTVERVDAAAVEQKTLQQSLQKTLCLQEMLHRVEVVFIACLALLTLVL